MAGETISQRRRSIRLKGYDYSSAGAYFVTVCTKDRRCLFGEVVDGQMMLDEAGKMVAKWYCKLSEKFADIECDEHVVMPNHIHAIVQNVGESVGADLRVCPGADQRGVTNDQGEHIGSPLRGSPLPEVVQWFKTMTTNEYIRNVKQHDWSPFPGKLWQRNYYERIIRDEDELNRIREYIIDNPAKWAEDEDNPENWK